MTFEEYQNKAKETAIYKHFKLLYPIVGLAGEVGEFCNKFGKIMRDDEGVISPEQKDDLIKELGDVLWFVSQVATDLDVELEEVVRTNVRKLEKRKRNNTIRGTGDYR